nr:MAG TPA: hypothetical protein [Caudoviricetes sp.]
MAVNYAYHYAIIRLTDGMCISTSDSTNYIVRRDYVPIYPYNENYGLKYYYPIPESVSSWDDFHGNWYWDAAHTRPFDPNNMNG